MNNVSSYGESRVHIEGRNVGIVRVRQLYVSGTVFPTLHISLGFQLSELEQSHLNDTGIANYKLLRIRGELAVNQSSDTIARFEVQNDEPNNPYSKYKGTEDQQVDLIAPIDPWSLERVERWRNKSEPKFFVRLWAEAEDRDNRKAYRCVLGTIQVDLPQTKWLDVLQKAGYGKVTILELPAIAVEDGRFKDSNEFLREAKRLFDEGNYRHSVKECREAVARVGDMLTKGMESDGGAREGEKQRKIAVALRALNATIEERANALSQITVSLHQLGNKASHRSEEHSREEARFILHTTAHLLVLIGDLMTPTEHR